MALVTVDVLRHGKATALAKGAPHLQDIGRLLSPEGMQGVERRRQLMGNPYYDLVLTSPATRAAMTALIMMQGSTLDRLVAVDELCYDGPDHPQGKVMHGVFNRLGHVSFGEYCKEEGCQLFENWGRIVWSQVVDLIYSRPQYRNVLVTGHHPFINALGHAAVENKSEWQQIFNDTFFREAEGYTLTLRDRRVIGVPQLHVG